jgi:hypothetical protein
MELDELKNLWKEDNRKLEVRIELNEKLLRKMNMEKAVGEFDTLIKRSILGRNLAFVYGCISLLMSVFLISEIEFSIPCIIGGLAMFWSFFDHLSIRKPDYYKIPIIELQKSISKFRIHSSTTAKYDISIVSLWLITLAPLCIRVIFHKSIYASMTEMSIFAGISILLILITISASKKIYSNYESKLKASESYLEEILEFEKV